MSFHRVLRAAALGPILLLPLLALAHARRGRPDGRRRPTPHEYPDEHLFI